MLGHAGATANATRLEPLGFLQPSNTLIARSVDGFVPPPPWTVAAGSKVALCVVSCTSDYTNQGFAMRVGENRKRYLEPLLAAWRRVGAGAIIHLPNGHAPDGACAPRSGEHAPPDNAAFDKP